MRLRRKNIRIEVRLDAKLSCLSTGLINAKVLNVGINSLYVQTRNMQSLSVDELVDITIYFDLDDIREHVFQLRVARIEGSGNGFGAQLVSMGVNQRIKYSSFLESIIKGKVEKKNVA